MRHGGFGKDLLFYASMFFLAWAQLILLSGVVGLAFWIDTGTAGSWVGMFMLVCLGLAAFAGMLGIFGREPGNVDYGYDD